MPAKVAALYDIHGNLPALEAVLEEVRAAHVDRIVVGGDVIPGPLPRETLERLLNLDQAIEFIHGNCERSALAMMAAPSADSITYWGTASRKPLPEPYRSRMWWSAERVRDYESVLAGWPRTRALQMEGLGRVLFCHATPRNETEIFTRETREELLAPIFEAFPADVVVCGHTHMQFERRVGKTRIVNAGSVGAPFGTPGAYWALLGPDVELRRTSYDVERAAEAFRATSYPEVEEALEGFLRPESEEQMRAIYGKAELQP